MSKTPAKKATTSRVTRIKASDETVSTKKTPVTPKNEAKTTAPAPAKKPKKPINNPLRAVANYFVGAWVELRLVRWPTRKATWSLTAAMLGFTAFFAVLILVLDALFKYVFQLILG